MVLPAEAPVACTVFGDVTARFVLRATEGFTARLPGQRRTLLPMNSSMVITDPLPRTPPRPGLWNLYLDVNGYWKLLNDWAPLLASVHDGQRLRLNRTVTIDVPQGRGVSLFVAGRECDEPSQQVVSGEVVPIVKPCPVNREEFQLANDDTGTILDNYRSTIAALGAHTSRARATA